MHVLGEPLLHPHFAELLLIAHEEGLLVNLTTNGSLLLKQAECLTNTPPRQINISLHDWEENVAADEVAPLMGKTLQLVESISEHTYTCIRLWNHDGAAPRAFNEQCVAVLANRYGCKAETLLTAAQSVKLAPHIFLQNERRFCWPSNEVERREERKCMALKTHVAILSDGSVVPCCIDANAALKLGNIFEQPLEEILLSERAQRIRDGFRAGKAVEPFCQRCGFRKGL